jgi:hypothetical protein
VPARFYTFIIALITTLVSFGNVFAEEKIELSPSAPYDRFIIFQNLAIFWIAIIGLIILIRLKLKEIERVQNLGLTREETDAPILE